METLAHVLAHRAERTPDRVGWRFLEADGATETAGTYATIDAKARAIAARLMESASPGDRVLLLCPPGLDFIAALFGCFYAGVIAVPALPPETARWANRIDRIRAIAAASGAGTVLATAEIAGGSDQLSELAPELLKRPWIVLDDIENSDPGGARVHPAGDSIAFLQYTSGSTGEPKGVALTHENLSVNSAQIAAAFGHTERSQGVIWLPPYHDMGLIGGVLQPLYVGFPVTLMAPMTFLQRPIRWLEAVSRSGATTSGGPDFAYQLCAQKIGDDEKRTLDLGDWSVAFTGAEPIRAETIDRFSDAFACCGFRKVAFYPCYGLAETTLMVSGGPRSTPPAVISVDREALSQGRVEPDDGGAPIVSCGAVAPDQTVSIVDPATRRRVKDDHVGEIWCAGRNIARGYWGRKADTEATFCARLDTGEGPFLRTGDLGFVKDGMLHVCGRLKDVMIIRGANHHPHDIERTIEDLAWAFPAFRLGGACAYLEEDGDAEGLTVALECRRAGDTEAQAALFAAANARMAEAHGLKLSRLILTRLGALPKTPSGKLRRSAAKAGFAHGAIRTLAIVAPGTAARDPADKAPIAQLHGEAAIIEWLVAFASRRTGVAATRIDIHAPFTSFGLDSLDAVDLAAAFGDQVGRLISPTMLWDHPTIAQLAAAVAAGRPSCAPEIRPSRRTTDDHAVAIIGLACRMPGGADDPAAFWAMLRDGVDAIAPVAADRPDSAPVAASGFEGGFVSNVDAFDAELFGISPREAAAMDPQQRLVLECGWESLERAGVAPTSLAGGDVGVFLGVSNVDYMRLKAASGLTLDAYSGTGNAFSIVANRLSYALDLRGPSLAIDTACSSSLVAVHQACRSLRQGECGLALAGGVNLILSPELTKIFDAARMLSPDSRCKTLDAGADGYVRGEGCAIAVLKRLSDATRDGDRVLAVIRGGAVNQDGRSNGLTAPNGSAQRQVIRDALRDAGVGADTVSYVELHGTGTPLGDPIEVEALTDVLGDTPGCAIGSVKTNIGHLEAAAGIAGLAKVTLALNARQIPAHLNHNVTNPHLTLPEAVTAPAKTSPWRSVHPLRAGVSSFGFGGTNAHLVIEEAPAVPVHVARSPRSHHALVFSARSETALEALTARHLEALRVGDTPFEDYCHSVNTGRAELEHRAAIVAQDCPAAVTALATSGAQGDPMFRGRANGSPRILIGFGAATPAPGGLLNIPAIRDLHDRDVTANADTALQTAIVGALGIWGVTSDIAPETAYSAADDQATGAYDLRLWIGDADGRQGHAVTDVKSLFEALAMAAVAGVKIDWSAVDAGTGYRRVDVPTYPFQRQRYWITRGESASAKPAQYRIAWRDANPVPRGELTGPVSVAGRGPTADAIAAALRARGADVRPQADTVLFAADAEDWRRDLRAALHAAQSGAKVHLITRCAQPVGDDTVNPGAAALWGFGRAAAMENRAKWGKMIDLGLGDHVAAALDEIAAQDCENQIALRGGARKVARLVERPALAGALAVSRDAAYLITGGSGALGAATARGLAARGARHLALLSRRPSGVAIEGCDVRNIACDVSDVAALSDALAHLAKTAPPLRGVVHAAGALDDGIIANQDWSRYETILGAKADGAWNLHTVTEDLDFFIMFSSLAGILGSAGQSSYAAANAFLDGLAAVRRRSGLPATSIAWGPFDAVGMARGQSARARRSGVAPMDLDELMPGLDGARDATHAAIAAIDWAAVRRSGAFDDVGALLTEKLPRRNDGLMTVLRAAAPEARRAKLEDHVAALVSAAMGAERSGGVDRRAGLLDLGVDSLMALEIKSRLQRDLDLTLEPTLIFNHPTIDRLAAHLSTQLFGAEERPAAPRSSGISDLLDRLEALDEDAAETLLQEELTL